MEGTQEGSGSFESTSPCGKAGAKGQVCVLSCFNPFPPRDIFRFPFPPRMEQCWVSLPLSSLGFVLLLCQPQLRAQPVLHQELMRFLPHLPVPLHISALSSCALAGRLIFYLAWQFPACPAPVPGGVAFVSPFLDVKFGFFFCLENT